MPNALVVIGGGVLAVVAYMVGVAIEGWRGDERLEAATAAGALETERAVVEACALARAEGMAVVQTWPSRIDRRPALLRQMQRLAVPTADEGVPRELELEPAPVGAAQEASAMLGVLMVGSTVIGRGRTDGMTFDEGVL